MGWDCKCSDITLPIERPAVDPSLPDSDRPGSDFCGQAAVAGRCGRATIGYARVPAHDRTDLERQGY